jgi:hypothetical protein
MRFAARSAFDPGWVMTKRDAVCSAAVVSVTQLNTQSGLSACEKFALFLVQSGYSLHGLPTCGSGLRY